MFWEFEYSVSELDQLLEREDLELEELLDNEELFQEIKNENHALVTFLVRPESLEKLVGFVVNTPGEDVDDKVKYKYPNISAEVLSANAVAIHLTNDHFYEILWNSLTKDEKIHPLLASFSMKVIFTLLRTNVDLTTEYLREHKVLDKLVNKMEVPAVMDVIARISAAEATIDSKPFQAWLVDEFSIVEKVIDLFNPERTTSEDALSNVAQYIEDVINFSRKEAIDEPDNSRMKGFLDRILSDTVLEKFLNYTFSGSDVHISFGLKIILALITEPPRGDEEPPLKQKDQARHDEEIAHVLKAVSPRLRDLHNVIESTAGTYSITTASGVLGSPFGKNRVQAVHLVAALVSTGNSELNNILKDLGTLNTCLQAFFTYPENNFLHRYVGEIIMTVTGEVACLQKVDTNNLPVLYPHLFQECKLLQTLMDLWQASLDEENKKEGHRKGYMGHLTIIGDYIMKLRGHPADPVELFYPEDSPDTDVLSTREKWVRFATDQLGPKVKVFSTLLGGFKPAQMEPNDSINEADTFDSDVNGNVDRMAAQYASMQVASDLPDIFAFVNDNDNDSIVQDYGIGGSYAKVEYDTDLKNDMEEPSADWRIHDGRDGPEPPMEGDEWEQRQNLDISLHTPVKKPLDDDDDDEENEDNSDNSSGHSSDSESGSSPDWASVGSTPDKIVNIPLSPRAAQAVAGMPTIDPFSQGSLANISGTAAAGGTDDSDGWANFSLADEKPQAMDISMEEYQASLDRQLEEADAELARQEEEDAAKVEEVPEEEEAPKEDPVTAARRKMKRLDRKLPKTPKAISDEDLLGPEDESITISGVTQSQSST